MKISDSWLREFVTTNLSAQELSDALTMAGLEVDDVQNIEILALKRVFIAEVLKVEPLVGSSALHVCSVQVGENRVMSVVCGAANVEPGMKTAYASLGATILGNMIEKRVIKGVESEGMLCSLEELTLEEKSDGIASFPTDCEVGTSLYDLLELPDFVYDIDLTPNRGDCFSVYGVARDLCAAIQTPLRKKIERPQKVDLETDKNLEITVIDEKRCEKYAGRAILEVANDAQTPVWMTERLRKAGVRCINPVVDITNYVMLEIGQPMHAFNLDAISEEIVVRRGELEEQLTLLDGQTIDLNSEVLVIADREKPIALAGVMGGQNCSVEANTRNIYLESAFFEPINLSGVARKFGLQTEASTRFERGVDPTIQELALDCASKLIREICGGKLGPINSVATSYSEIRANRAQIMFRPEYANRVLGTKIHKKIMKAMLESLEFEVTTNGDAWLVVSPSHRFDIEIEMDLIEEVARLYGYNKIKVELPRLEAVPGELSHEAKSYRMLRDGFRWRSFSEVITYSFISEEASKRFSDDHLVALNNPISSEMSVMRPLLLSSMLQPLIYNINRQKTDIRLFEIGNVFTEVSGEIVQRNHVCAVRSGLAVQKQWNSQKRESDFYDLKADLEALIIPCIGSRLGFSQAEIKGLHPGQAAEIMVDNTVIGFIGVLHPLVCQEIGIETSPIVFEVNIDLLPTKPHAVHKPVSKFPFVRRDLSIVVSENIAAQECIKTVKNLALDYLIDLQLFDLYTGQGVDINKKSFSLGLIFQSSWSTLTDSEVDNMINEILVSLKKELGAELRK